MSGRWSQFDSDSYRLPHGFVRVGYDADSGRYFFRDLKDGQMYQGNPGETYGVMKPLSKEPFDPGFMLRRSKTTASGPPPKAFSDILSKEQITSAETANSPREGKPSAASGVTAALKRSTTSAGAYLKSRKSQSRRTRSEYTEIKQEYKAL